MRKSYAGLFLAVLLVASGLCFAEEQDTQAKIVDSINKLTDPVLNYQGKQAAMSILAANPAASAPRLIEMLETERNFETRLWVLICINSFNDLSVFEPSSNTMVSVLDDQNFAVRFWGVRLAGRMRNSAAVQRLVAMLKSEHAIMKREVLRSLGQIGQADAIDPIVSLLKDEDNTVRAAAADALGQLKAQRALPELVKVLQDKSVLVVNSTISAIETITGKSFGIETADWLGDPSVWNEKIKQWVKANAPEQTDEN